MEWNKPVCKYGASCYRKNPDHLKRFAHPGREAKDSTDTDAVPPPSKKQKVVEEEEHASSFIPAQQPSSSSCVGCSNEAEDTLLGLADSNKRACVVESDDLKENIRKQFLVDLPEDFYLFWEFCKSLEPKHPSAALKRSLGLELVGPYDVLAGRLKGVQWEKCVLHSRHYYDPPEMTTVLTRGAAGPGFHIGYFRDNPDDGGQFLLVSNDSEKNCELAIEGGNIFSAVRRQLQVELQGGKNERDSKALKTLDSKLSDHVSKLRHLPLGGVSVKDFQRRRAKDTVAVTFNKLGIVVPYDESTELGYRPLPMSDRELLKLLNKICSCSGDKTKQDRAFEPLQEIVTFVQFANDECDYGMGLELGMDLFCHGDEYFHNVLQHLLPLAYELLGCKHYANICKLHLTCREKTPLNCTELE